DLDEGEQARRFALESRVAFDLLERPVDEIEGAFVSLRLDRQLVQGGGDLDQALDEDLVLPVQLPPHVFPPLVGLEELARVEQGLAEAELGPEFLGHQSRDSSSYWPAHIERP